MRAVYCAGRFQPPTIGHARLIEAVIHIAQRIGASAYVFVSKTRGKNDPLSSASRVMHLYKMFPEGVNFIDCNEQKTPCGGPLLSNHWLRARGFTETTFIAGSDREDDFGPGSRMWKNVENPPKFVFLPRDTDSDDYSSTAMSGTKARALAKEAQEELFYQAVRRGSVSLRDAENLYDELRHEMGLFVPARARMPSFVQFFRSLCGC